MSVEFSLTGCKLDCEQWNELLEKWADAQKDNLYDEPCFEDDGDEPTTLIWGDGSTRGVVLRLEDGEVTVRFNVLASRKDWERGFEIMKRALAGGGGAIERETGEAYTADKLTRDQAHEEAITDFVFGANSVRASVEQSNDKKALLPFASFALPLTPADLPACTRENQAAIEEAIAQRLQKYGTAFRASVFQTENKALISTWGLEPTVVGKVDYVSIEVDDQFINVPTGRLVEILGSRVDSLGGSYYLPELDPEKEGALLEAIKKEAVEPEAEGTAADEQGQQVQMVKQISMFIAHQIFEHGDAEKAKAALIKQGLEAEMADGLLAAVTAALTLSTEAKKSPKEVAEELAGYGIPSEMARAICEGVSEYISRMSEEEDDE